jgi:branched-chain amino acid transport system substrate-binding protein
VLVLSASPAAGRVAGSQEFAQRYMQRYGPIANYAVNAYDAGRLLLLAIEQAATAKAAVPERAEVVAAMQGLKFQGIAYPRPHEWDAKGDNKATLTALHVVEGNHYRQIAEIGRDE